MGLTLLSTNGVKVCSLWQLFAFTRLIGGSIERAADATTVALVYAILRWCAGSDSLGLFLYHTPF